MDNTNAERQARWRKRRAAELEALRKAANKAAPLTDAARKKLEGELLNAQHEIDRLSEENKRLHKAAPASALERELRTLRNEYAMLRGQFEELKVKLAKPPKPKLDPESEAARQIEALKKKNKKLQQESDSLAIQLRSLVPTAVKTKIAKALTEQSTSRENRLDALQAWNGLGLNNLGKRR
jgi:FtsZ-binding cell division protein ZapB